MCLHTKYYTKGTVYSSVKAKAVDKGWKRIRPKNNALSCIAEIRVHSKKIGVFLHTVPYWLG